MIIYKGSVNDWNLTLVYNVQSWQLFSIERESLSAPNNSRLLFTEINNTAQTEGKLVTAFQYICLIAFVFFSPDIISKIFLLQLLILFHQACQLLIGINEREQNPKTNKLFRNVYTVSTLPFIALRN